MVPESRAGVHGGADHFDNNDLPREGLQTGGNILHSLPGTMAAF